MASLRLQPQAYAAKVEDGSIASHVATTPPDCEHHTKVSFLPALEQESLIYSLDYLGIDF